MQVVPQLSYVQHRLGCHFFSWTDRGRKTKFNLARMMRRRGMKELNNNFYSNIVPSYIIFGPSTDSCAQQQLWGGDSFPEYFSRKSNAVYATYSSLSPLQIILSIVKRTQLQYNGGKREAIPSRRRHAARNNINKEWNKSFFFLPSFRDEIQVYRLYRYKLHENKTRKDLEKNKTKNHDFAQLNARTCLLRFEAVLLFLL